jgi:U2 small nuclear ribonucleoprotein A'
MRLSAELLESAEQRTDPLGEREIVLRGLAIPAIEHLGVTRDAVDAMDFTDNRLGSLENFPKLLRLSSLKLSGNFIETVDAANLAKNVPNLQFMDLSNNRISSLFQVAELGKACPKLQFLSLNGNSVTSTFHGLLIAVCSVRAVGYTRSSVPSWI